MTKSIVKGSIGLTVFTLFYSLVTYLIYLFLSRALSPEEFGIFSIAFAFSTAIAMVFASAIEQASAKFTAEKGRDGISQDALALSLKLSLISFAALFILSDLLAFAFNDPLLSVPFRLASFYCLFAPLFSTATGLLSGRKEFGKQGILYALYSILRISIVGIMVLFGFGLFGAIAGMVFAALIILFFAFKAANSRLPEVSRIFTATKGQRMVFYFALPLMLLTLFTNFLASFDLFAVKALTPIAVSSLNAGVYSAASSLSKIPYYVLLAFPLILIPLISGHGHKKIAQTRKTIRAVMRYSLMALAPIVIAIFLTADSIINFFYPSSYAGAALPFAILVVGMGFFSLFGNLSSILIGLGRPKIPVLITAVALAASICLNFLLVPQFSIEGAAISTAIACLIAFLLAAFFVLKETSALFSARSFFNILVSAAIAGLSFAFLHFSGFLIAVNYLVFFAIYLFLLKVVLKELKADDFRIFMKVFK